MLAACYGKPADNAGYLPFARPGAWRSSYRWTIAIWTVFLPIMSPTRFRPSPIFEVIESYT